ncbi:MAG: 50S ribosomal protein L24 [Clostridia bacterium]|nr:50S ribosomal protein L24 [Clostridia bacterium]
MLIKKNDTVVVITGKDKGKQGKVLSVNPKKNTVVVEGVNMQTKHQKQTRTAQSEIKHIEGPINASNVMLYDAKAKQGVRVKYDTDKNGKKVRVSVKTGNVLD